MVFIDAIKNPDNKFDLLKDKKIFQWIIILYLAA